MTEFVDIIFRAIYEYKKILKRYLPQSSYIQKIKMLGINRMHLRDYNEIDLFQISKTILNDLQSYRRNLQKPMCLFSGMSEFVNYLEDIIKNYSIENDQVVNSTQEASRAIVSTLQIISYSTSMNVTAMMQKINPHVKKIVKYASFEQIYSMANLLRQYDVDKKNLIYPLLRILDAQLQKRSY